MRTSVITAVVVPVVCALLSGCSSPTAPGTVTSVAISGTTSVFRGLTSQLTAKAILSNGATQEVTGQATWSSSDSAVATVSSDGLVNGQGMGTADIVATYQGLTSSASVAVTQFVLSPSTPLTIAFQTSPNTADRLEFFINNSGSSFSLAGSGSLTAQLFDGGSLLGTSTKLLSSAGFSFEFFSPSSPLTSHACCPTVAYSSLNSGTINGKLVLTVSSGSVLNLYPRPNYCPNPDSSSTQENSPGFYFGHTLNATSFTADQNHCVPTNMVVTGVFAGASQPTAAAHPGLLRRW